MPPHDESPEPARPDLPGARPREQGLWVQWWQARRCTHHNELGITFPGTVSCSKQGRRGHTCLGTPNSGVWACTPADPGGLVPRSCVRVCRGLWEHRTHGLAQPTLRGVLTCEQTSRLKAEPGAVLQPEARGLSDGQAAAHTWSEPTRAALPASCSGSDSDASSSPSSSSELQLLGSLSPSSALRDLEVSSSYSSFSLLNQRGQLRNDTPLLSTQLVPGEQVPDPLSSGSHRNGFRPSASEAPESLASAD